MIDHLLSFASMADAVTALSPLGFASTGIDRETHESASSFASNVILNIGGANDQSIRIILSEAIWDRSDPDPHNWTITTPEVLAAGWHAIVCRDAIDTNLRDLPGNACRLIADRDAALRGESFMRYLAADIDPAVLASARVEPTPAGARYPFGN